jgi:CRISPR system Cascade subunit CasC
MKNHFTNTRIEFHILQSFPVTCLNRDDVGSPKTATIGGTLRARVSSQCWKRHVRIAMKELGVVIGTRTKWISKLVKEACLAEGASEEEAKCCGDKIHTIFFGETSESKKKIQNNESNPTEDEKTKTLIFLSPNEISMLAKAFKEARFVPDKVITQKDNDKKKEKKKQIIELAAIIQREVDPKKNPMNALDIALFGRMVADAAVLNIEAAASFSHAISTHKITNEIEFFTALDDVDQEKKELGASHLGNLEFNSATYYRYVCLDLGQLCASIGSSEMSRAVETFTKALFLAVPGARQTTMSGASHWDYARILIRTGQRLQIPFESAIKKKEEGFLQSSIEELNYQLDIKEKRAGSLFGKIEDYTFGDSDSSIDDLISALKKHAEKVI